jgi:hypothetical protein
LQTTDEKPYNNNNSLISYFGSHVKLLVPASFCSRWRQLQFQGGLTSGMRPVVKIIAEALSPHDDKHVVSTPLSGIRVAKTKRDEKPNTAKMQTNSGNRAFYLQSPFTISRIRMIELIE